VFAVPGSITSLLFQQENQTNLKLCQGAKMCSVPALTHILERVLFLIKR